MDFTTDLPKSSKNNFTVILILVCHLTKMTCFVTCHKEITTEDNANIFIDNCYKLRGVPNVIVFDRDPRFVATFWQSFMRKFNTKLKEKERKKEFPYKEGILKNIGSHERYSIL